MLSSGDRLLELVGLPYADNGRDPATGFDCFGLALYATRAEGIDLPDNVLSWRRAGRVIRGELRPRRLDWLCFADRNPFGLIDHVGVALNEFEFIHAGRSFGGVVCDRITRYRPKAIIRFT